MSIHKTLTVAAKALSDAGIEHALIGGMAMGGSMFTVQRLTRFPHQG